MSTQPTITMQSMLRALWREIDAEGGAGLNDYTAGYHDGIEAALNKLEATGFSEKQSTAADLIDVLIAERDLLAAQIAEIRSVIPMDFLVAAGGVNDAVRLMVTKGRELSDRLRAPEAQS